jgi:hypothetical protein
VRALVVAMQQWSISPEEISRYDQSHREIDTASSGFVSGAQARQMFTRSNLQQADLRQIWQLSDVRGTGTQLNQSEFRVAMHLIHLSPLNFLRCRCRADRAPEQLQGQV